MAKKIGDGEDAANYKAVFVDTSLDTHLAIPVSSVDTIFDLKVKIPTEHLKCFQKFGEIEVHDLKVEQKGIHYSLSDLMPVTSVFSGSANGWFLFADISNQLSHYKAVDHNTEFPQTRRLFMLTDTSPASQFQRRYDKDERNLRTDNLSGEARSENLQLVAGFKSDDKFKSSSSDSDKRLNALVEDIYNASCEKGKNSDVLVNEVTSVNPVSKPLDIGSLEKNKPKKKGKIAAHAHSLKGNHAVGIESADKDSADVTIGSDKTMGSTKKNNLEVMNDETFTGIDAPVNVSGKALAAQVDVQLKGNDISELVSDSGKTEKVGAKNVSMYVQCNNSTGSLMNIDQAGTEELGMLESLPDVRGREKEATARGTALESGMKRSKKRKNSVDDVSHQMDIKGSEELGVPDIGDMEKGTKLLAESGMTRPSKRKKTGDDLPDVIKMNYVVDEKSGMLNSKQQNQTQKSKKKIKPKQTPVLKNISEFAMRHQSGDTMEPEKSKSTLSKSAAEKDDNIETVSSPSKQMDQVLPVVTSEADIEINTKLGVNEVLITNDESDVKSQQVADDNIHNDAEPMQHTQIQKSVEGAKIANKRSSKKTKQNQKHDNGKSKFPKSTAENDDEMLSSCQEQIDRGGSVADSNAGIETRSATGGVDDKVFVANHESVVSPPKETDETVQCDAVPKQLTRILKREKANGSKSENSKKKIKQKPHLLKSISVEDQNNSIKLEGRRSTQLGLELEKDNMNSLSSPVEQIDNVSLISASQADAGISTKAQVDEVIVTNHGSDVNLQKKADDTSQNDVEPIQLTQVKRGRYDTENRSVQTKKKSKQKLTHAGKSLQKVVEGDKDDSKNDICLDTDPEIAPAEVSLNAAKSKGSGKTSSGSEYLPKSINTAQQERSMDFSSAKRQNPTDPINLTVEDSTLMGRSADAGQQDRSISSAEELTAANIMKSKIESSSLKTKDSGSLLNNIASAHVENRNDSRTSSSHSDFFNKRLHQGKSTKELPKMKKNQSNLRKSFDTSTQKVVQNPSKKKSIISKCSSIFKDESSSSSEDKCGGDASNSSTETPHDDHVSSSEDESRGSWASPKHGKSENGGSASYFKSMDKNLTMQSVLKSSHKYKKAKLIASQLQLEDDESQAVETVLDSQANT